MAPFIEMLLYGLLESEVLLVAGVGEQYSSEVGGLVRTAPLPGDAARLEAEVEARREGLAVVWRPALLPCITRYNVTLCRAGAGAGCRAPATVAPDSGQELARWEVTNLAPCSGTKHIYR